MTFYVIGTGEEFEVIDLKNYVPHRAEIVYIDKRKFRVDNVETSFITKKLDQYNTGCFVENIVVCLEELEYDKKQRQEMSST